MAENNVFAKLKYTAEQVAEAIGKALNMDKLKPGKVADGGEIFGNIESSKVGSKGFRIIDFEGKHDNSGYYTIECTKKDDYLAILKAFNSNGTLWVSINNDMWADSYSEITSLSVWNDDGRLNLYTPYIYTNQTSNKYDSNSYTPSKTKGTQGTPWTDFPELGWSIANNCAYLFINDHPELGTIQLCKNGVSFGEDNISQGDTSLNSGYNNRTYGRFAHNFGRGLKSGYATTNIGRNNDARWAQNSLIAGIGHKVIERLRNAVTMLGAHLIASNHYQVMLGVFNKGKPKNVLEIGRGTSESNRKNVFEIDENGNVYTNEKLFPGQLILNKKSFSFNGLTNLITDISKQVTLQNPNSINKAYTTTPNKQSWTGFIRIKPSELGLIDGNLYALCVKMNVTSETNISNINIEEVKHNPNKNQDETGRKFQYQLSLGENNVILLFRADTSLLNHGFYIYCPDSSQITFSYSNLAVYKIPTSASYTDEKISYVTCSGIETLPLSMDRITYGASLSDGFEKNLAFTIDNSLYFIGKQGTTYTGNIYSCDKNLVDGYSHLYNKENPHGVTAEQVGAYPKSETCTKSEYGTLWNRFNNHEGADNPHNITPAKIRAYSAEEVDVKLKVPASYFKGEVEFTNDNVTVVSGEEYANQDGNSFSTSGGKVVYRIDVSGKVEFSGGYSGALHTIMIDGETKVAMSSGDDVFSYSGQVKKYIEITVEYASVIFGSFTVENFTSGCMSGEDKEKLDKLKETEAKVEDEQTSLKKLREDGKLTYIDSGVASGMGGVIVNDYSIDAYAATVSIAHTGYVEFDITFDMAGGAPNLSVDENKISLTTNTYHFAGYINQGISFYLSLGNATLYWHTLTFEDGYMSGEDKWKLDNLSQSIGDISSVLESIIEIQSTYSDAGGDFV